MKKTKGFISLLCCLSAILAAPFAMAISLSSSISCPDIGNKGSEKVYNSGTLLSGEGSERLHVSSGNSKDSHPLFSAATPAGVPIDLVAGGYHNSGTSYNASTDVVTCKFASTLAKPDFQITYTLKNIKNGIVTSSGLEEIKIKFDVGLVG